MSRVLIAFLFLLLSACDNGSSGGADNFSLQAANTTDEEALTIMKVYGEALGTYYLIGNEAQESGALVATSNPSLGSLGVGCEVAVTESENGFETNVIDDGSGNCGIRYTHAMSHTQNGNNVSGTYQASFALVNPELESQTNLLKHSCSGTTSGTQNQATQAVHLTTKVVCDTSTVSGETYKMVVIASMAFENEKSQVSYEASIAKGSKVMNVSVDMSMDAPADATILINGKSPSDPNLDMSWIQALGSF